VRGSSSGKQARRHKRTFIGRKKVRATEGRDANFEVLKKKSEEAKQEKNLRSLRQIIKG